MKSTYIYLNTYPNGYLYVGSHTWSGPPGHLDPNYHGSSSVARKYDWLPVKEVILENVTESRKLSSEKEWIEFYLTNYGVAPVCLSSCKETAKEWLRQFPKGVMINCHSASLSTAHTLESRLKAQRTKTLNGFNKVHMLKMIRLSKTPESLKKNVVSHNYQELSIKATSKRNYKEISLKRTNSTNYKEIASKNSSSKRGVPINRYNCKCGTIKGSVLKVCRQLGNKNWSVTICKRFKQGSISVVHHGFLFERI